MKVAIVGSRNFLKLELVREYVRLLPKDTIVVSGGASGVDTEAVEEAKRQGLGIVEIKPEWAAYGKAAGPIRNREIVNYADEIVAFYDGESKGTKNTIDIASSKHKPLTVIDRDCFISHGNWNGKLVIVIHFEPCTPGHHLEVMHHTDDDGNHYCPTGYLMCIFCCGLSDEPEPYQCTLSYENDKGAHHE